MTDEKANLRNAGPSGKDLRGKDLRGANLRYANLRSADLSDAELCGAELCGADLCGADLSSANLRGANLCYTNLRSADLHGADMRGADLYDADLGSADLRGANLRRANLRGAELRGARVNWNSHDLIAEILLRAAGNDVKKMGIAGLVLVNDTWCWNKFLDLNLPLQGWALSVLREWVHTDDDPNTPRVLLRPRKGKNPQS